MHHSLTEEYIAFLLSHDGPEQAAKGALSPFIFLPLTCLPQGEDLGGEEVKAQKESERDVVKSEMKPPAATEERRKKVPHHSYCQLVQKVCKLKVLSSPK